jgi:uncharacterized RmlC-like cupin family protein
MSDVSIVRKHERDGGTAQTPGMRREAGVSSETCGAEGVWMGEVTVDPAFRSAAHHHGDVESGIYIASGRLRFRWGAKLEHSAEGGPGDFIFVPAMMVHQEINASDSEPVVTIVSRGGDNIVVNVEMPEAEQA